MWCRDKLEKTMLIQRMLLVFVGGGCGAVLRFIFSLLLINTGTDFPIAILVVNVVGSFFMGVLAQLVTRFGMHDSYLIYLLIVGLLGGFTTFSTFSINNVTLILTNKYMLAALNIVLSLVLSLLAAYLGILCAKLMFA